MRDWLERVALTWLLEVLFVIQIVVVLLALAKLGDYLGIWK